MSNEVQKQQTVHTIILQAAYPPMDSCRKGTDPSCRLSYATIIMGAGTWGAGWATAHPGKIRVGMAHPGNINRGLWAIDDKCLNCEDIARQSCAMVPRCQIFGDFSGPTFPASRVQHISELHSKFALRPHHAWKYGRHPICDGWYYLGEEKRKKKNKRQGKNIMVCPIP